MIEHMTNPTGKFSFEFNYLDNNTNEIKDDPIDGYVVELKEINGKSIIGFENFSIDSYALCECACV